MSRIRHAGRLADVKKAGVEAMIPLLSKGLARVTHNARRDGHVKLSGDCPNFMEKQYEVLPLVPDDIVEMVITVAFEYNRCLNRGWIRISERDAEGLWPVL